MSIRICLPGRNETGAGFHVDVAEPGTLGLERVPVPGAVRPRRTCLVRVVAVLLFLVLTAPWMDATALEAGSDSGPFRAACVKVEITPETPQWLQGYAPRQSQGVHDRIYHRIVAMDDGKTTFFLVSTDICTVSPSFYHAFQARLHREAGIPPERIWWSTTHTHSAPHVGPQDVSRMFVQTLGDRFSIQHDTAYWERVTELLLQGIQQARAKLEPARLGIGSGTAPANVNRRQRNADGRTVLGVNPDGVVDRQLGLLRLERPNGKIIALIANYAIHGTALGGRNQRISGDVPGFVSEYVEQQLGAPLLFINGAEGDVAPLYSVGTDFDHPRLLECQTILREAILAVNETIAETTADVAFSLGKTLIETPRRAGLGWSDSLPDYTAAAADGTALVRVPVYSLTLNGDTAIWAAPLELFSQIAINVRDASPFAHTFYFGLTNGSLLYLPTKAAFAEGGYEPNVSPFTEQAEADFTSGVIRHLQQLGRR